MLSNLIGVLVAIAAAAFLFSKKLQTSTQWHTRTPTLANFS